LILLAVVALLAAGVVVGRLTFASDDTPREQVATDTGNTNQDPPVQGESDEPIVAVAEAVGPAVVLIETDEGLGSGVVYDESGLVMTNAHVVGSSDEVVVRLADGTSVDGEVLGADTSTDIAVVQIDEDAVIEVACLALGEEVRVGQTAVGIGSPFGLEQTVTQGIVSAVDRPFPNGEIVVGMIQTDAPINSGNSGGALANRSGCVMGINTAIFSNTGDNSGIGFAIPIDVAHTQAQKIVDGESLETGFLGVTGDEPTNGEAGVLVVDVDGGSAADDAGIEVGDVIMSIDGEEVHDIGALAVNISAHSPGDEVEIELERDGDTMTLDVELGSR
jgi:S1-C subfamily serine protease